MPLLENIRPSIRDISREEAMRIILSIRHSRHVLKKDPPAERKTHVKQPSNPLDILGNMTKAQQAELLALLEGGGE